MTWRPDGKLAAACFLALVWSVSVPVATCAEPEVLEITQDTVLDPARTYGPIIIKASNVTIDGRGAWLIGERSGDPKEFTGTAVLAENVSNVSLTESQRQRLGNRIGRSRRQQLDRRSVRFLRQLPRPGVRLGRKWAAWRDPAASGCRTRSFAAAEPTASGMPACWSTATTNRLEANDFSHTSNTCLKLWNSTRNSVVDNNAQSTASGSIPVKSTPAIRRAC